MAIAMSVAFSTKLSHLRKEMDLTQRQVAEDLGISQALLSHYENGIRECNLEFVGKAARYYGVSADYLLGITENDTRSAQTLLADALPSDTEVSLQTLLRALLRLYDAAETQSRQAAVLYLNYFSLAIRKYTAAIDLRPTHLQKTCDLCEDLLLQAGSLNTFAIAEEKKQPLATIEAKAAAIIKEQIGSLMTENED